MTPSQTQGVAQLMESLTSLDQGDAGFSSTLNSICQIAGTPHGGLWRLPSDFLAAPRLVDVSYSDPDGGCKLLHNHLLNYPGLEYVARNWATLDVVRSVDVVGWTAWTSSPFYSDYLKNYDRKDNMVCVIRAPSTGRQWLVALCHQQRNAFTKETAQMLGSFLPSIGRGLENLESWRTRSQESRADKMLAAHVGEPVAAVAMSRTSSEPVLRAATGAASKLLGLDAAGASRNTELRDFLRVCRSACNAVNKPVTWKSRDGQSFKLAAVKSSDTQVLVRFVPENGAMVDNARDRELALTKGLTAREAQVFSELAKGLGNKEIGRELGMSPNTARTHVENIFEKLGVSTRVEAINAVRG